MNGSQSRIRLKIGHEQYDFAQDAGAENAVFLNRMHN